MSQVQNSPKWTDEQYDAIVSEGSNILVAAAAGSGKTAVLVERIIRKISNDIDVDRLLVATFTSAAATEMKDRIKVALEKKLEIEPENMHLRKQLALMGKASIMTLHSFCLEVVKSYYPLIKLDPGFRIANETEIELIRADVLDDLFEERYSEEQAGSFISLVNHFGSEKGDDPVFHLIEQLFLFSRSHPWPDFWLDEVVDMFNVNSPDELAETAWIHQLQADTLLQLEGALHLWQQAMQLTYKPAGPHFYGTALEEEISKLSNLMNQLRSQPFTAWANIFEHFEFASLPRASGKDYNKDIQQQAKSYRDKGKKALEKIKSELFARTLQEYVEELQMLYPLMLELAGLVKQFAIKFDEVKREKGLLDFADLEHYCLAILLDEASIPDHIIPSAIAKLYQEQYEEILLDEYQDTNMVQETICRLIAKAAVGNRFMVGDVKQSIYRFRLAEPALFMQKYRDYKSYSDAAVSSGKRIDLARNFRSREQVIHAVNIIFKMIMKEEVAEMEYDERAELVFGASSYPEPVSLSDCRVQVTLIDRTPKKDEDDEEYASETSSELTEEQLELDEFDNAQLEGRYIASELLRLKEQSTVVYDHKNGTYRPFSWRDVVILLRSTAKWAPIIIEELQHANIPAYASIGSGYFEALEIQTMLAVLKIIDNPYQDIPLAATLRSPLFNFSAEALAQIRIVSKQTSFYEAVVEAAGSEQYPYEYREPLSVFLTKLDRWRDESRVGSLADLLWSLLEETGYYDFVGGLPGGQQRQANLKALHDRARQYESTSFRGLFRFLQFIEKMQANDKDLGKAQAIGEQEDVVRIMTTHASKGLEFPIVFVASLGKQFNEMDLKNNFLYHKQLGLGPKVVDEHLKISYPSLPFLAIKRAKKMELLAEEMRILYVAVTRPKEKLYLVGTVKQLAKQLENWMLAIDDDGRLINFNISAAKHNLDWLGPIVAEPFLNMLEEKEERSTTVFDWDLHYVSHYNLVQPQVEQQSEEQKQQRDETLMALQVRAQLAGIEKQAQLRNNLEFVYQDQPLTEIAAKASITEMKRLIDLHIDEDEQAYQMHSTVDKLAEEDMAAESSEQNDAERSFSSNLGLQRPRFLGEKSLSAVEKGSVHHLVMQHLPLDSHDRIDLAIVKDTVAKMVLKRLITDKQSKAINAQAIASLFDLPLGKQMLRANWLKRELPFSFMLPANRIYPNIAVNEQIFIQGVIDCLFEDEQGITLVDYKTDRIYKQNWAEQAEKHRFQLEMYAEGIAIATGRKVNHIYVFFFDGGQAIKL